MLSDYKNSQENWKNEPSYQTSSLENHPKLKPTTTVENENKSNIEAKELQYSSNSKSNLVSKEDPKFPACNRDVPNSPSKNCIETQYKTKENFKISKMEKKKREKETSKIETKKDVKLSTNTMTHQMMNQCASKSSLLTVQNCNQNPSNQESFALNTISPTPTVVATPNASPQVCRKNKNKI